jgi:ankyrin repeat protein
MEKLSNQFPDLITMILENVDDESLANVKEASREMSNLIENKRFYWIRILNKYYPNFQEFLKAWKMVIEKTPVDIVQKLAVAVEMFFSKRTWSDCLWPSLGNLEPPNESSLYSRVVEYDRWPRLQSQWSPLHIAAECRDLILLKHVISRTEDENHQHSEYSDNHLSVLHLAAQEGFLKACEFIINRSLYKGEKDRRGWTPIDYAAIFGHLEVCRFLLQNIDNFPMCDLKIPLLYATHHGHTEVFKLFFEHARNKNLPVNPPDSDDETPLHKAASRGNLEICELIVGEIENKSPISSSGCTPLHDAAANGSIEIFKLIFDNVQDKEPVDNKGCTPFHQAAFWGRLEVCKFLLEESENKNPRDNKGWTPLHHASEYGRIEVCKLLVGTLDKENPRDNEGRTPLHLAAQGVAKHEFLEVCKLLFEGLDNNNPSDNKGRTPLHHAAKHGNLEVCKLLIRETDYVNSRDFKGWTPLHCAAQNGHEEICDLIDSKVLDKNPTAFNGTTAEFLLRRFRHYSEDYESLSPVIRRRIIWR